MTDIMRHKLILFLQVKFGQAYRGKSILIQYKLLNTLESGSSGFPSAQGKSPMFKRPGKVDTNTPYFCPYDNFKFNFTYVFDHMGYFIETRHSQRVI